MRRRCMPVHVQVPGYKLEVCTKITLSEYTETDVPLVVDLAARDTRNERYILPVELKVRKEEVKT